MPTKSKFHTISFDAARELIWSQRVNGGGRIFGVSFNRLEDSDDGLRKAGDTETLYCRFNVKKHCVTLQDAKAPRNGWMHPDGIVRKGWIEGARPLGAAYDRAEKDCFCVYVVGGKKRHERGGTPGYRSIKFTSVRWIKLDGIVYKVGTPPPKQH